MKHSVLMQVRFQIETEHGTLDDAVYMTPDEYAALKDGDIEHIAQARAAAYFDRTPLPVRELTDEEKQIEAADIDRQIEELIGRKQALVSVKRGG